MSNNQCTKCDYYHGELYGDVWLNCAPHPVGIEENCPDFEEKSYSENSDLFFVSFDEATTVISSSAASIFENRNSSHLINESASTSFNFLDGYFINGETRNLIITMIENIYDYKLNLLQRRAFKNAMRAIKEQSNNKITLLEVIEKFSTISSLAELSNRMR